MLQYQFYMQQAGWLIFPVYINKIKHLLSSINNLSFYSHGISIDIDPCMSEMLANHYYQIKNYQYAGALFQEVVMNEPKNYEAKKKLIVCLLKEGIFYPAWKLYKEIIENEPQVIFDIACKTLDCLCLDVLEELQKDTHTQTSNWIHSAELGILYSFKDIKKSLYHFKQALKLSPLKSQIENVISRIELCANQRFQLSSTKIKEFL